MCGCWILVSFPSDFFKDKYNFLWCLARSDRVFWHSFSWRGSTYLFFLYHNTQSIVRRVKETVRMEQSVKAVVLLWLCLHYCVSAKSFASNSDEDSSLFDEQSKQLFGGNNRLPAWLNRLRNTLPSALTGRVRFSLFLLLSCSTFVLIFTTLVTPFSLLFFLSCIRY